MKLATYKDGSRDGQLVVVSRDLGQAHFATATATRLQQVLDDWNFLSPQLQDLYVSLNQGRARHAFAFDARQCMAPLPRAYQWAEGSAYPSHLGRLRLAGGATLAANSANEGENDGTSPGADGAATTPATAGSNPLMAQGGSDHLLGPCDDAWFGSEAWAIDFEAGLAVVTGDVAMGASPAEALDGVRLLMLANSWRLRNLIPAELALGFGLLQSKPASAFSPVAVTPDELGPAWQGGRVHLALQSAVNGKRVGLCETGPEMHFHFGQLIAHLAKTRKVSAGSVVGSGTVSNTDASKGWHCIAEQRAIETLEWGAPRTPFLAIGDTLQIDMSGPGGLSVFGAIAQRVAGPLDLSTPPTGRDAD
jgi:fumarylacetoacetate (FAA) hydrolase